MNDLSGIYMIFNKINHKRYIGSSKHIYERWKQHKTTLNKNKHRNIILQYAWNKYGSDAFEFIIVELCSEKELLIFEQFWYDYYQCYDQKYGYNYSPIARNPIKSTYTRLINEELVISYEQFVAIIHYLTTSNIPIPIIANIVGVNQRTVYAIYFREEYTELTNDIKFIHRKNSEFQSKISNSIKKLIIQEMLNGEYTAKIAKKYNLSVSTINDVRYHRIWKDLTKDLSFPKSNGRTDGDGNSKIVIQYSKEGEYISEYKNARIAALETNVNYKKISAVCCGNRKTAGGYVWRFKGHDFDEFNSQNSHVIAVDQYDSMGNYINSYSQIKIASEFTKAPAISIKKCLDGKLKSAGGFHWIRHGEPFVLPEYCRKRYLA